MRILIFIQGINKNNKNSTHLILLVAKFFSNMISTRKEGFPVTFTFQINQLFKYLYTIYNIYSFNLYKSGAHDCKN